MFRYNLPSNIQALISDCSIFCTKKLEDRIENRLSLLKKFEDIDNTRHKNANMVLLYWMRTSKIECIQIFDFNICDMLLSYTYPPLFDFDTMQKARGRYIGTG